MGTGILLQRSASCSGGGPGPLKVEAPEVTGDINDFADKEQTRHFAGFHGFAGEFAGVHAAGSDFGFFVTFSAGRGERPRMELPFESANGRVCIAARRMEFKPARGDTIGKKFLECFADSYKVAAGGFAEGSGGVAVGSEVDLNGLAFFPVRRNLENGGATEAAMSEEHFLPEGMVGGRSDHVGGDTCELSVAMVVGAIENERNEPRPRRDGVHTELTRKVVTKGSGAHLRDGESAGGDDKDGSAKFGGIGAQDEFGGALDFGDARIREDLHIGGTTFDLKHIGDIAGGIVAEELTKGLFVPRDLMFIDQSNEINGRKTGQGGFGEVGIAGDEIFRRAVSIGEIAAATAGDEYLFADAFSSFEDSDTPAALPCLDGAEESGGASAENQNVEGAGQGGLTENCLRAIRAKASVGQKLSAGKKR